MEEIKRQLNELTADINNLAANPHADQADLQRLRAQREALERSLDDARNDNQAAEERMLQETASAATEARSLREQADQRAEEAAAKAAEAA